MAEQVGSSVVGKVVDSLFGVAKKEIGYMWYCSENIETFKRALRDLKDMRDRVQQQIGIAKDKGDNLVSGVENWVVEADEEISKAEVFLEQEANAKKTCFKIGMCGNWATLHRYGKMATKMTPSLLGHKASGTPYEGGVSVYTRAPGPLDVFENKDLDGIHTHNSALDDIIAALENDSIQITGIYGLGGVGKTTLAKEVVARVKNALLFADVAFTTVTQKVDAEKIKKDLENATKRIVKGDKILIILDDVWEKLNLEELCIPCGSNYKNCKILLTSRSEKVCQKMNAQSKICVNSFPLEEAWILFERIVGERLETEASLKPVALKVVEECGGLPLLIQAVGNALKDESIKSWESALTQLHKHAPLDIDEEIRKSFTHLKLSYDYLKSKEAKSCFLLCSLFPEDEDIKLENLVLYVVGLGKFDNLDNIRDARDRVKIAVNILTSSGLLLNVKDDEYFTKMHDVVRDVALLIASEGENKFSVDAGRDLTKWLPRNNNLESSTGISLMFTKIPGYEVHQPHLDIFCINKNSKLPMSYDEFIGGIEVKVLDMACNGVSSVPQSFQLLTKFRMLNLEGNKSFHEISILGKMKHLEILILNDTGITGIPQGIGQLVKLRRLEVNNCEDLYHITPGVISKLLGLEELFIDFRWVCEGVHDCLVDIMNLSKLTYLSLLLPVSDVVPEGFNFERLKGFVIHIGRYYPAFSCTTSSARFLVIEHLRIPFLKWTKKLIEVSRPNTILQRTEKLKNIMPTLYDEGFNTLEHMELKNCPRVSCLVDSTSCYQDQENAKEVFLKKLKNLNLYSLDDLEVLWKCPDEYISLTNLVTLTIEDCGKLVRLFSVSVAQGLVNLKDLIIINCHDLEEVIWDGEDDQEINRGDNEIVEHSVNVIVFHCLANILFLNLHSLKRFFNSAAGDCNIKYPSLVDIEITGCISMEIWGPGVHETPVLNGGFPLPRERGKIKRTHRIKRMIYKGDSDDEGE